MSCAACAVGVDVPHYVLLSVFSMTTRQGLPVPVDRVVLLPMCKSAIRALDTIADFAHKQLGYNIEVRTCCLHRGYDDIP